MRKEEITMSSLFKNNNFDDECRADNNLSFLYDPEYMIIVVC